MQMSTFHNYSSSATGEPSAPTENTVWIIKTDNYCSLACAAQSPGCVMAIDFSVRDVLYRHCLYFFSVLLVQPPSSTACISAGCGCDAPVSHCFPPSLSSPPPLLPGLLLIPVPALGLVSAPNGHSSFFKPCFWPGIITWKRAVKVVRSGWNLASSVNRSLKIAMRGKQTARFRGSAELCSMKDRVSGKNCLKTNHWYNAYNGSLCI